MDSIKEIINDDTIKVELEIRVSRDKTVDYASIPFTKEDAFDYLKMWKKHKSSDFSEKIISVLEAICDGKIKL